MTPGPDTAAIACLSAGVFATCSIPVLLLAGAEHLTPRPVRELPLTTAALLLLLGGPAMHDDDQTPAEPTPLDPAREAMREDGYTSLAQYLAVAPFPQQQDRRHTA